jgi:hypothetical protein
VRQTVIRRKAQLKARIAAPEPTLERYKEAGTVRRQPQLLELQGKYDTEGEISYLGVSISGKYGSAHTQLLRLRA